MEYSLLKVSIFTGESELRKLLCRFGCGISEQGASFPSVADKEAVSVPGKKCCSTEAIRAMVTSEQKATLNDIYSGKLATNGSPASLCTHRDTVRK